MKSFRKIMICVLSVFTLTACSKQAKSVSISDAFQYLSAGQYQEAIDAFSSVIAENPNSAEAYAGKGDAYAYSGEYIPAAADYAKAVQFDENNSLYLLKSAVLHSLINENDEAEKNLKKVIESGNGTITSWDASEVTDLITKLKAEDSAKAVLDFINTAAKEDETAAVPASETPKADSTPTPVPTPTPETKPADFKGTIEDIKNLNELLECIAYMTAPLYGEENSEYTFLEKDPPFEPYNEYYTVNRFKTVDEYISHYKKYMTDEMAKKMIRLSYRFAVRNGKLYSLAAGIGYGGMSNQVSLVKIDSNGDYIVRVSYMLNVTDKIDHSDDYRFRYVDGKFVIADLVTTQLNQTSGYVKVNTNHLNVRKQASTSSDKIGRLNEGALLDVYEVKKDGQYTWYKVGAEIGYYNNYPFAWIADNGSWLTYVPYQ